MGAPERGMDHETLQRRLDSAGIDSDGSELHGMLCGLLCGGARRAEAVWLDETLAEGVDPQDLLVQECRQSLRTLFRNTRAQLDGDGLGFALLLPDDDRPARERAASVARWCQGFLYGIGVAGDEARPAFPEEAAEALQDIAEISKMDVAGVAGGEAEERALAEVVEFLRVAVMLLWEDKRNSGGETS